MFTDDQIEELNCWYDLDGGGYTWENPPKGHPLADLPVVLWPEPDLDYVGLQDVVSREHRYGSLAVLAFAPNSGHFPRETFPAEYPAEGGWMMRVAEGDIGPMVTECNCNGRPVWGHVQHEGRKVRAVVDWQYSDDGSGSPCPDCERCGGEGVISSTGGEWAFYVWQERGLEITTDMFVFLGEVVPEGTDVKAVDNPVNDVHGPLVLVGPFGVYSDGTSYVVEAYAIVSNYPDAPDGCDPVDETPHPTWEEAVADLQQRLTDHAAGFDVHDDPNTWYPEFTCPECGQPTIAPGIRCDDCLSADEVIAHGD